MDLNPFRICSPLKSLGYSIIIVVLGIIGVSHNAVSVLTLGPHILDGGAMTLLSVVLLTLFHALLVLLSWNYFMVLLKDPGSVPATWKMSPQQNVEDGDSVISSISMMIPNSATMTSSQGSERKPTGYCDRCQNGKPPRCHHCSVYGSSLLMGCQLRRAQNYKFFLLFVFYTFLETLLNTLVLLPNFIKFFRGVKHRLSSPGKLAVTFLAFVLNLAFALILLCFLIMHASLMISNITSVEVFGTRKVFWPFPLFSKEDLERVPALHGIDFPH